MRHGPKETSVSRSFFNFSAKEQSHGSFAEGVVKLLFLTTVSNSGIVGVFNSLIFTVSEVLRRGGGRNRDSL